MDVSLRGDSADYQPYSESEEQKKWVNNGKEDEEIKPEITFMSSTNAMIWTGPLNILLLCVPIAMISYWARWPDGITFVFALLGLAPLAERLGFVTEQLAFHTNETIGGLLNATFGNATELIVAITALQRGLFRLVQLSLLGSILSNMLLVLGTAFLFGGFYHKTQSFGTISSQMNATLLMLATMGVLFPTVLTNSGTESTLGEIGYSRATSVILFLVYFAFLYFQLISHKYLYEERPDEEETEKDLTASRRGREEERKADAEDPNGPHPSGPQTHLTAVTRNSLHRQLSIGSVEAVEEGSGPEIDVDARGRTPSDASALHAAIAARTGTTVTEEDDDDDDEEEDVLGFNFGLIWLAIMTVFIAILSDAISGSIESAASSAGISGIFLSAIVLPIVGNAAEHAGAVMFAVKGKLDLSLGVAIGSSTQIALCVLPLLVIIGWMADLNMSLNFGAYEASTLFLSVVSVTFAIKDGHSNWLLGATLIAAYVVISVGFWAHTNEDLD